jgi:5-methylcytosine-specific restriction protein A
MVMDMAIRTLPWRIKTPSPRIKTPDTAGGRNVRHYQSNKHQLWALGVKRRDNFTCQKCGASGRDVRLVADHIIEIDDGGAPLEVKNGMTLCIACHNRKTAASRADRVRR